MEFFLDIYGYKIKCTCDNPVLFQNLKKDFQFFLCKSELEHLDLTVEAFVQKIPFEKIPKSTRPFIQNDKLIAYQQYYQQFYNYHYELLTIIDTKANSANIFSENKSFIHEMTYLFILSKSGKALELKGLHKIHGCGLSNNDNNILIMAPSKGGKSTMFLELLQSEQFSYFSDDTPLVDIKGQIHPFALRVGISSEKEYHYIDYNDLYSIDRKVYGTKHLIPTTAISRSIENCNQKKNILLFATRSNSETPFHQKLSFMMTIKELVPHFIVGIGLPMIIEFFLETKFRDYFKRAQILFSRIVASLILAYNSDGYLLQLTEDPKRNAQFIKDLIKDKKI